MPVEPMLAAPVHALPVGGALPGGCWYEPKFDGYRGLVFVTEDGARVQSRRGHDITGAFPDIVAAAAALPAGTVLDGELVVWGDSGLDFPALQQRLVSRHRAAGPVGTRPASLMVFDLLAVVGSDVRGLPLSERRQLLEQLFTGVDPPLQLVPYTLDVAQAQAWLEDYAQARVGIEGLVIKGAGTRYEPGRRGWAKYRIRDTVEVVVGAVTGTLDAPGRLVLGFHERGRLVIAGSTGVLGRRQRLEVAALLREAVGEHPWPSVIGPGRMGHWGGEPVEVVRVEPTLVVEVSGDTAVDGGRWRHQTRFVRVRPDLGPHDVTPPE